MSRYVTLKLTEREAEGVFAALEADISLRREAVHNNLGERIDSGPDALDAIVPAQQRALAKVKKALHPDSNKEAADD